MTNTIQTMKRGIFFAFMAFFLLQGNLSAQETNIAEDKDYRLALELFEKGKYGSAYTEFIKLKEKYNDQNSDELTNIEFYAAVSAMKLNYDNAGPMVSNFITKRPESARINEMKFYLGKIYYQNKNYNKAIRQFEDVRLHFLKQEMQIERDFMVAYSHFMEGEINKAYGLFTDIARFDSKFSVPATYYSAHINFQNEEYDFALEKFESLRNQPRFQDFIPVYMAQIYYRQNRYNDAIAEANAVVNQAGTDEKIQLLRVLGASHYSLQDYETSLEKWTELQELTSELSRDDYYFMGLSHYQLGNYENAAGYLTKVDGDQDRKLQAATFFAGQSYLQLGDKDKALKEMEASSRIDLDKSIHENALLTFAKLSHELGYSPFNQTMKSIEEFLTLYPNSSRRDEAYRLMEDVIYTTENYEAALELLNEKRGESLALQRAYQKISYKRGLELYQMQEYNEAIFYMDQAINAGKYDTKARAMAYFWKGESEYGLGKYAAALSSYYNFILQPEAKTTDEYSTAHYNMGYSYFKLNDFEKALLWFGKFTSLRGHAEEQMMADAYSRMGDCYLMQKNYRLASQSYDKALNIPGLASDYALFQRAMSEGLAKNYNEKINLLQRLLQETPQSAYADDAIFEIGMSYVQLNQNDQAIGYFRQMSEKYKGSPLAPKSFLQLGLIYFNQRKDDQSVNAYMQVINEYRNTPEARLALQGIRTVYAENNEIDKYIQLTESLGNFADMDQQKKDSLLYAQAEQLYLGGDYLQAAQKLKSYLEQFPQGSSSQQANYFLAESYRLSEREDLALKYYEIAAGMSSSPYWEDAAIKAANIHYQNENFDQALNLFRMLRENSGSPKNIQYALEGITRISFARKDYPEAAKEAVRLLESDKVSGKAGDEINYIAGKSLYETGKPDQAMPYLKEAAMNTSYVGGAEANYLVARIHFDKDRLQESEEAAMAFIDKSTPHQYWLARSFILLSDIYLVQQQDFQAKQYLLSIRDNYKGDEKDIEEMVAHRLETIRQIESARAREKDNNAPKINM